MVATGGGMVITPENWGHLRSGVIIWLDVPIDVLRTRLESDITRPILQSSEGDLKTKLESLLCDRSQLYAQADLRIAIDHHDTPETICDRILAALAIACEEKATETAKIRQLNDSTPFQTH